MTSAKKKKKKEKPMNECSVSQDRTLKEVTSYFSFASITEG